MSIFEKIIILVDERYREEIEEIEEHINTEIIISKFILKTIFTMNFENNYVLFLPDSSVLSPNFVKIVFKFLSMTPIVFYSIDRFFNLFPTENLVNLNGCNIIFNSNILKQLTFEQFENIFRLNNYKFSSSFINIFRWKEIEIRLVPYILESLNFNIFKKPEIVVEKEKNLVDKIFYNKRDLSQINLFNLTKFQDRGTNIAILLESRKEKDAELILRQFSRFLPPTFSCQLWVTENCREFYENITSKMENNIKIKVLTQKLECVQDYNEIMLSLEFWTQFADFEKVLIFQFDTMIYKKGIEAFYKYDYIGAPWPAEYKIAQGVGNGGFTLRTVAAIIDCLKNYDKIVIQPYENSENNLITFNGKHPEDVFYSNGMRQLGYRVASIRTARQFSNESCFFIENPLGSHQLSRFNRELADKLLYNSVIPYWHRIESDIGTHRFGWKTVSNLFNRYFNNFDGIQLISYADVEYLFNDNFTCNGKPWIGIIHTTPLDTKSYYQVCNLNNLKRRSNFIKDLEYCKHLIVLSENLKKEVEMLLKELEFFEIPVYVAYHPIEFDGKQFDENKISNIRNIVFIGSQIRRMSTIFKLKVPQGYRKIWLAGRSKEKAKSTLKEECEDYGLTITREEDESVEMLFLSDEEYDELTLNSLVILHQINCSANNTVLECIARNIPIFCNRLPALLEYIGKDYPLFFETIEELEYLILDQEKIKEGFKYLVHLNKSKFTYDHFLKTIYNLGP